MTKSEAIGILDAIRDGYPVSIFITNQALERTGDISRPFGKSLCTNGDAQRLDRPCALHDTPIGERVGWSRYLDCKTN